MGGAQTQREVTKSGSTRWTRRGFRLTNLGRRRLPSSFFLVPASCFLLPASGLSACLRISIVKGSLDLIAEEQRSDARIIP
jgi:hypothetical protein